MDDERLEDMIRDVRVESFAKLHGYENMFTNAETSLYPGPTNFILLSMVIRLMHLKAING